MIEIIAILAFLLFFVTIGVTDGVLWSRVGADAFEGNEHIILNLTRLSVVILALIPVSILTTISMGLLFPLVHNGSYYETRKHISKGIVYPDGWKSEPSPTSTAEINLTLKQRVGMAAVGFILLITSIII
jgi:hypothetical protein